MGCHADIGFDLLASQYLLAVEQRRYPAATVRQKFGLSAKQWEHRRIRMGQTGWLPAGDPVRDGIARGRYDQAWLEAARRGFEAKLRQRCAAIVARELARAHERQTQLLRQERAAARRVAATQKAVTQRPSRAQRPSRVLDTFL